MSAPPPPAQAALSAPHAVDTAAAASDASPPSPASTTTATTPSTPLAHAHAHAPAASHTRSHAPHGVHTHAKAPSLAASMGYKGYLQADPVPRVPVDDSTAATSCDAAAASAASAGDAATSASSDAMIPYPASSSSSSSSSSDGSAPPNRQYARTALKLVGDRAQTLAQSSKVVQFGVSTTAAVASAFIPNVARRFTIDQWATYGDPLLSKIDQRIDEAFQVVEHSRLARTPGGAGSSASATTPTATSGGTSAPHPEGSPGSGGTAPDDASESSSHDDEMKEEDSLTLHAEDEAMYAMYWQKLKGKFVNSRWYSMVDEILLQNRVVEAFSARMVRPAENFYNTVTEEFLTHATMEEFMAALKLRVGPAWDDRLTPLAKGFYTTAKAVSSVVGAGKFVGGALQLGRARVHNVIDTLIHRWEQVLGTGDDYVDRWLPDSDAHQAALVEARDIRQTALISLTDVSTGGTEQKVSDADLASLDASRRFSASSSTLATTATLPHSASTRSLKRSAAEIDSEADTPAATQTDEEGDLIISPVSSRSVSSNHLSALAEASAVYAAASNTVSPRTSVGLASKVSKRLRQRMPSFPSFPPALVAGWADNVRARLTDDRWFSGVDEILLQNTFVQALAAIMQPADHFFNTSLQLFQTRVLKRQQQQIEEARMSRNASYASLDSGIGGEADMDESDAASVASVSSSVVSTSDPQAGATAPIVSAASPINSPAPVVASRDSLGLPSSSSASDLTAFEVLPPDSPIVTDFVHSLKRALGASWDERLGPHARTFFNTAWTAVRQVQRKAQAAAS